MTKKLSDDHKAVQSYYDAVYYDDTNQKLKYVPHLRQLTQKMGLQAGQKMVDVACGRGELLLVASEKGVQPSGIDISEKAITLCQKLMPAGDFHVGVAESLPFADNEFDIVTCLGSLEHFLDPLAALREMRRVAKPTATFLFLVPNAGFLTHRLGFFRGTNQTAVHEVPLMIEAWAALFNQAGLAVSAKWRDLHILSLDWILAGRWFMLPFRLAQALSLLLWPLAWQYQIYFKCQPLPE